MDSKIVKKKDDWKLKDSEKNWNMMWILILKLLSGWKALKQELNLCGDNDKAKNNLRYIILQLFLFDCNFYFQQIFFLILF